MRRRASLASPLAPAFALALAFAAPGGAASAQSADSAAATQRRIDALEQEIRRLTAALEETQFALRKQAAENAARFDDVEFRLTELEGGDPTAAIRGDDAAPAGPKPATGAETAAPPTPPAPRASPAPVAAAGPGPAPGAPAQPLGTLRGQVAPPSEQAEFDAAMRDLEALGLAAGSRSVAGYLSRHPDGALAGEARLALGGAYVEEGRLREATRELVAGLRLNGDQPSGPPTLLMLAETLEALGQRADACAAFLEFDIRYPAAPGTLGQQAREGARRLGCR